VSTLYERLRARIDRDDPHRLLTAWKAVRAVVELHAPIPCGPCSLRHEHIRCGWCTGFIWPATESLSSWPCPTITAIAEALGIGETP